MERGGERRKKEKKEIEWGGNNIHGIHFGLMYDNFYSRSSTTA